MDTITRPMLKALREKMNDALSIVGEEMDMVLTVGNMSFDDQTVKIKVNGALSHGGTVTNPKDVQLEKAWNEHKQFIGVFDDEELNLSSLAIGDAVRVKTMTGKFVGYDSKKRKFPFIVEVPSGARYKLSTSHIKAGRV